MCTTATQLKGLTIHDFLITCRSRSLVNDVINLTLTLYLTLLYGTFG